MQFLPIKTKKILPPKENIYLILEKYLPSLCEEDILIITSKIIAIHQGRTILKTKINKNQLIKQEADKIFGKLKNNQAILTLKNNTFIPNAGIDESNAGDYYILWPENCDKVSAEIRNFLLKKFKLKKLGVIISDSYLIPRRRGTLGISLGFAGFSPVKDYKKQKDLFGRELKITEFNLADSIAAFATFFMGEGKAQTPIIIGRDIPNLKFSNKKESNLMPSKKDLYSALI